MTFYIVSTTTEILTSQKVQVWIFPKSANKSVNLSFFPNIIPKLLHITMVFFSPNSKVLTGKKREIGKRSHYV